MFLTKPLHNPSKNYREKWYWSCKSNFLHRIDAKFSTSFHLWVFLFHCLLLCLLYPLINWYNDFFLEGCDVRVLEKPPGGYFTYEEIKEASSFALFYLYKWPEPINRASDILRKKKQNCAGFSGANLRKNRPISRDFRRKKVKIRGKSANFAGFSRKKSQNSPKKIGWFCGF